MNESPETDNGRVATLVRLPADIHRAIKEMADREHRSVNKQVVHLLEQFLDQQVRAA